jgi:hypothetical protein
MVLVAHRHGLRPVELVTLREDAIDFAHGQIHVSRARTARSRFTHKAASSCGRATALLRRHVGRKWKTPAQNDRAID